MTHNYLFKCSQCSEELLLSLPFPRKKEKLSVMCANCKIPMYYRGELI